MKFHEFLNKTKFTVNQHAPQIAFGVSVASGIGALIFACRGTIKARDVVAKYKDDMATIKVARDEHPDEYTKEDAKKDKMTVRIHTGIKLGKVYLPMIGFETLSIVSGLCALKILNGRYVGASMLAASLQATLEAERDYVRKKYGDEAADEVKYSVKEAEVETEENGKKKKSKHKVVDDCDKFGIYEYSSRTSYMWDRDLNYNLSQLSIIDAVLQSSCEKKGYLFLNDLFKACGMPETEYGHDMVLLADDLDEVIGMCKKEDTTHILGATIKESVVVNEDGENYIEDTIFLEPRGFKPRGNVDIWKNARM